MAVVDLGTFTNGFNNGAETLQIRLLVEARCGSRRNLEHAQYETILFATRVVGPEI